MRADIAEQFLCDLCAYSAFFEVFGFKSALSINRQYKTRSLSKSLLRYLKFPKKITTFAGTHTKTIIMVLGSNARVHVFRIPPRQDLKKAITSFTATRNISACVVLTCVGSLEQYNLRFANARSGNPVKGYFEIVSLTGTISHSHGHLHMAIADSEGKTIGGHLLDDNLVYTTAEVALAELPGFEFDRQTDPTYGYAELVVKPRHLK